MVFNKNWWCIIDIIIIIITGYIYLVQEREYIRTDEQIYKIGKTRQENLKRISSYSNWTKLICQFESKDCDIAERGGTYKTF